MNPNETNHAVWNKQDIYIYIKYTLKTWNYMPLPCNYWPPFSLSNQALRTLLWLHDSKTPTVRNPNCVSNSSGIILYSLVNIQLPQLSITTTLYEYEKRGESHPHVYVYQHHYHILYKYIYHEPPKTILQILQHQTTSVCPTHKARSMLALARPVPATMVQWPRGVNPRLGLKRSPQRLTCHLPWQPFGCKGWTWVTLPFQVPKYSTSDGNMESTSTVCRIFMDQDVIDTKSVGPQWLSAAVLQDAGSTGRHWHQQSPTWTIL